MNSTSLCISYGDGNYEYILLAYNPTKKFHNAVQEFDDIDLRYIRKDTCPTGDKSTRKSIMQQVNTTSNIYYIADAIRNIVGCINPDYVVIEAPAFAANGRIIDLAGLNYAIRLECHKQDIPFYPVSPTTVKAHAVGNGHAKKDVMVNAWLSLFPKYKPLEGMKIDDLADSYFLCTFDLESVDIEPGE